MINLLAKFEVSISTDYEDTKSDAKYKNEVVWGSWGHWRSLQVASFDRAHRSSY